VPVCVDQHTRIALSEAVVYDLAQPGMKEWFTAGEVKDMGKLRITLINDGKSCLCLEILLGIPAGEDVTGPAVQIAAASDLQVKHEPVLLPAASREGRLL